MASELDIINDEDLEAPLKLAANYKKLANDFDAVVASTTQLVNKLETQDATIADLTRQSKQLEKETKKLEAANKRAAKSAESMAVATNLADDATGGMVTRVKALGTQLLALFANPVVAFFAAIAVVLSSVAVYFRSTNEGADKFERIMAALNGVVSFFTNKIADLGEQIVLLFEGGNVLGEIFLGVFNRIVNIISGVIDSFTNILKVVNILSQYDLGDILTGNLKPEDINKLQKAFVDLGRSGVQAMTGIGTAADELGKSLQALDELTIAGQELGDRIRDRILSKAQAELEIEKLLFDAKDKGNKTDQERLDALRRAVTISQDQLKIDLDIANQKEKQYTAELARDKGIISTSQEKNRILAEGTSLLQDQALEAKASDEQLEKRKQLQADVINLQRAFFAENKKAIGQIAALQKEIDDEMIKQAELQVKARLRMYDDILAKSKEIEGREIIGFKSRIEEQADLQHSFDVRMVEDAKKREEEEKERQKRYTELVKAEEEKRRLIRETAIIAVGMIGDEIFARRQEKLAEEYKAVDERREAELAAAGDDERKKLAINRKFDREQAKIKTKQAQADKQAAIFGIIINTALGIMKASPAVPLMIATGILGAIQLALVASKPIPKFAIGSESTPDTFIAGERGRELVRKNGKSMITTGPTLFTGMEGARVFSNPHTEEILGDISDIGPHITYGSIVRRTAEQSRANEELLRDNNRWLKRIANKEEVGLIVDDDGFHRYSSKVEARNKRLNRRFYGK